jgi:hypothetical protein
MKVRGEVGDSINRSMSLWNNMMQTMTEKGAQPAQRPLDESASQFSRAN